MLTTYSVEINNHIKNKHIKFELSRIYSNPRLIKNSDIKLPIIKDIINYKISISTIMRRIPLKIMVYSDSCRFDGVNTYPNKVLALDLTNRKTFNIGYIQSKNLHIDVNTNTYYFNNLKKKDFIDLFYKKNEMLNFFEKTDLLELPPHIIDKTNQKIINSKNNILTFYENQHFLNMQEKILFGKNLLLN
jgi:hypothetical protein